MKKLALRLAMALAALCALPLSAGAATDLAAVKKQISQQFTRVMPGFTVESVAPSVISGLYEVQMLNGPLLLATATADYFIDGDLYTTQNSKLENVSEVKRKKQRVAQIEAFDPADLIVFKPAKPAKHWVAVFTDTQCGYCRKFHKDVPTLNKMGIEVRYFSYPIFNGSRELMISALCADDPKAALTALKTGGSVPAKTCDDHGIDAQYALARQFQLTGTPGIVLDDGTLLKGYVEPAQLAQQLGL